MGTGRLNYRCRVPHGKSQQEEKPLKIRGGGCDVFVRYSLHYPEYLSCSNTECMLRMYIVNK
ncbi:hypothetical protein GDO78_008116 [Eleutherodactylus coqui]|uniref:Uncharacterized protein n=1 Tax=Eleutherodactylus coqui TaxID=57060 RepID=A0A8J6FB73_ELECQ|nr:hypothetical protein GDO78_008116 [Eleutherodactylus coqui]